MLTNGVAATNLGASAGSVVVYTMDVPAGETDINFVTSCGSGDADMYVKFGATPTDSSYDCRPYKNGNNESCSFTSPGEGTWNIDIYSYSSASGLSLNVQANP